MAISKLDLQKAIENGKSLWYLYLGLYKINLIEHSNQFIDSYNHYCYTDKEGVERCCPLNNLFKTKAGAEHHLHHANITRTETLPFLTWEEFNKVGKINFYDKNHCYIEFFINRIEKPYMIRIINHGDSYNCWDIKDYDYSEENFYKAYDECVKLFKGEE